MKDWRKKAATAALGVLGITGCETINAIREKFEGEMMCMYGVPTSEYRIHGTVTDEQNKPIKDIKVVLVEEKGLRGGKPYRLDSLKTDADGKFSKTIREFPQKPQLEFSDVDGAENGGEFQTQTITPEFTQVEKGDGSWYHGAYDTGDLKIKMKKK